MASFVCKKAECSVSQSGKCLDGFPEVAKCPHSQVSEAIARRARKVRQVPEGTDLPKGSELSLTEASRISRAEPSQVLLMAGSQKSGKTTLALSLYERFQRGRFADHLFAGSETLIGFERRCFDARVESERQKPKTERTPVEDGTTVLHLRLRALRQESLGAFQNLLLADLSGEYYERACSSQEECQKLALLPRADRVILLLDGARLLTPSERGKVLTETRQFLASALDSQMLGASSVVEVLFAKWDLMANDDDTVHNLTKIESKLSELFRPRVGQLLFDRIAARPDSPTKAIPPCFGLELRLRDWCMGRPARETEKLLWPRLDVVRQSDRFVQLCRPDLVAAASTDDKAGG